MPTKEYLLNNGVTEVDYRNISTSLENLALFLKIRENNPIYDPIKEVGRIGLPLIVFDDKTLVIGGNFEELDRLIKIYTD